jgi:hypothetical protein
MKKKDIKIFVNLLDELIEAKIRLSQSQCREYGVVYPYANQINIIKEKMEALLEFH